MVPKQEKMGVRLFLLSFVLVAGALVPSWVQDPIQINSRGPASVDDESDFSNDPVVEISASHFTFQRRLTCEYVRYLQQELQGRNDRDLSRSIDSAVDAIEHDLDTQDLHRRTKRLLKHTSHDLKKLGKAIHRKEQITRALNMICHAERFMVGNTVRATAWIGTALTTLSSLPVRFVFSFGKGLFTGREPNENLTTFNKTFGRAGRGIASIPLYELTRRVIFAGANPFLLPFFTAPLIDRHAALICEKPNEKNPREVNFCKNYRAIKNSLSSSMRATQHAGVKMHESLLGERAVCSWKPKKQVRWVRDLLRKRHKELMLAHPEILDLQIGIPQYGECVSIEVRTGQNALGSLSDSLGGFYEGVSLRYVANETSAIVKPDPRESVKKFCEWVHEEKLNYGSIPPEKNPDMKRLQLTLNPARFARLDPHVIDTPRDLLRSLPMNEPVSGRNVILYFGPTDEQREVWKTHESEYQKDVDRLTNLTKKFRKIVRQNTMEDCVAEVTRDPSKTDDDFDYIDFLNLRESVPRDSVARAFLSESGYKSATESAGKRFFGLISTLKLKWELIAATNLNDLEKVLRDSSVENLVLLGHGFVNGMIADSSSALYHNGGFSWLTHRLHSLSFFSCYSKDIKTYSLEKKFAQTPTIHPRRHYFTMQGDQIGSDDGQSVLGSFPAFLEELDDFLARSTKGNVMARGLNLDLAPLIEHRSVCRLKISGVKSERGSYTVRMGFNDVGTFDESYGEETYSFLCDWMKETPIIQFINQRVSDTNQNVLKIENPRATIRMSDGSEVVWSGYETFPRKSEVIRGLRLFSEQEQ